VSADEQWEITPDVFVGRLPPGDRRRGDPLRNQRGPVARQPELLCDRYSLKVLRWAGAKEPKDRGKKR